MGADFQIYRFVISGLQTDSHSTTKFSRLIRLVFAETDDIFKRRFAAANLHATISAHIQFLAAKASKALTLL